MKGAAAMSKYIVVDWAGNVMNWGEYSDFDYASEAITNHVLDEMSSEGLSNNWLDKDFDKLTQDDLEDERNYYQWCEEYYIDEIKGD